MIDTSPVRRPDQPNILYILADDLGWGDISLHGSPIRTPNIDRLAVEGLELTQHYVCPMCTPTRASLLTGRHPGRFGAHATVPSNAPVLPDGYATLATLLRDAGYDTGLFGKWHLGSSPQFGPNQFGFNTSYGSLAGGVDPYNHFYKRGEHSVTWHRNGDLLEERGHVTDLVVREASQWIESRQQPWFAYVPFTAVHVPVKPTSEWLSRYFHEDFDDDPAKDLSFKKYAAYTSHMDWGVGQLLESLERTGQRDNTLVVFTSDNGGLEDCPLHGTDRYPGWQEEYPRLGTNRPYRGVKAQLYEGGVRTPALVSWRGQIEAGIRMNDPVQVVDWMPAFCDLAGAVPQEDPHWDGQDISPRLLGSSPPLASRSLYWNFRGGVHLAARVGDWKLIRREPDSGGPVRELFHIGDDPHETQQISRDHPDVVDELQSYIDDQRQLDDSARRPDAV
ncbi:MAG TPA: sulfatase-like hydrolase/transferase [Candidatus Latescibacteria bacterium]|jgi:arylsulfatase A-like enzyme|nr:sulfatase [Gemmatimonadaceae bacterium]MDP6015313.1 sulfatase-like hydrolase/transferase [Candidatus Latescibacterota bacterium]HJP32015.1 sulfatase-like hydrolase/transferase [Candidatus Latescibacterota bacterium]